MQDPILWTIFLSLGISQGIKILQVSQKNGFSWKDLVVTGGMPSSHSALVMGMVLILYLLNGPSPLFYVMLVIALIVLRDALGVRRTAGEVGKMINKLLKKVHLKLPKLHYSLGHTPLQVIAGMCIGAMCAMISFYVI